MPSSTPLVNGCGPIRGALAAERLRYESCRRREGATAVVLEFSKGAPAIKEVMRRTSFSRGLVRKNAAQSADGHLPRSPKLAGRPSAVARRAMGRGSAQRRGAVAAAETTGVLRITSGRRRVCVAATKSRPRLRDLSPRSVLEGRVLDHRGDRFRRCVFASWMLDPAACADMNLRSRTLMSAALADLTQILIDRGYRRSSSGDVRVAREEQNEATA